MVRIEKVLELDELSREAILLISDGTVSCEVFAHPYDPHSDLEVLGALRAFMATDIVVSETAKPVIIPVRNEGLRQRIVGKVVRLREPIVTVGEITIEVDGYLPGDIKVGDIVEFSCMRLEVG